MNVVKRYPDGLFSWVDLATTDPDGAKAFYSGLFGWEFEDLPIDGGGSYSMGKLEGHNVAGLGEMQPEQKEQGMPPVWTSYVNSEDVDAVAGRINDSEGQVILPPMDVMDAGRMLMASDPGGAVFGVWQPKNHIGAEVVNYPNTLVWNELQTRETEKSGAFYTAVFSWGQATDPNGYGLFKVGDRIQAGMMEIDDSWGDVPNNWAVYFRVSNLDEAVARVNTLGGNILVPPTSAGEMGRFAVAQDPQGGAFTIMEFNDGQVDSPPGS